jgi:hypothetical protein
MVISDSLLGFFGTVFEEIDGRPQGGQGAVNISN